MSEIDSIVEDEEHLEANERGMPMEAPEMKRKLADEVVENAKPVVFMDAKDHSMTFHKEGDDNGGNSWMRGPRIRWSPCFFVLDIRGAEYFHLYLWMMKDLAWTQDWYYSGLSMAISAVIWSGYLIFRSIMYENYYEICLGCGQFLWLFGNLWWMSGEIYDHQFPPADESGGYYTGRQHTAGAVLSVALGWIGFYYIVLRGHKEINIKPSKASLRKYDESGLICRYPFIHSWREYENLHILWWCGKDTAWNLDIKEMWIVFAIPTVVMALDFVIATFYVKSGWIDHVHYAAQFIWVVANLVWAVGELWRLDSDEAQGIRNRHDDSEGRRNSMRWISGALLVAGLCLCAVVQVIWITLTALNKIPAEDNKHSGEASSAKVMSSGCIVGKNVENQPYSVIQMGTLTKR